MLAHILLRVGPYLYFNLYCMHIYFHLVFRQWFAMFLSLRYIHVFGLTENDGHENDGPSKLQGMKLQDMKLTDQCAGCEIAGRENDGPNDKT